MTKEEIRDRSAEICAHGIEVLKTHTDRADRAGEQGHIRAFIRHTRRALRVFKRHLGRLAELRPPPAGRARYRTFVDEARAAVRWGDLVLDAYAAKRYRLFERRVAELQRHLRRSKRAARRYPLRRVCIKFLD
jgi:hypothetical protein